VGRRRDPADGQAAREVAERALAILDGDQGV
jgi:hypothetical protein